MTRRKATPVEGQVGGSSLAELAIQHIIAAGRYGAGLSSGDAGLDSGDYAARSAQVHAELAVAFELRTANLLAYLGHTETDEYDPVHKEIRARLGLGGDRQ